MNRRNFLMGLIAAPAIIRTPGLLMPIKRIIEPARPMLVSLFPDEFHVTAGTFSIVMPGQPYEIIRIS